MAAHDQCDQSDGDCDRENVEEVGQSNAVELVVDPSESSEPDRFVLRDDRYIRLDELCCASPTFDGCFDAPDVRIGPRVRQRERG